jgi:hypothetical protein
MKKRKEKKKCSSKGIYLEEIIVKLKLNDLDLDWS